MVFDRFDRPFDLPTGLGSTPFCRSPVANVGGGFSVFSTCLVPTAAAVGDEVSIAESAVDSVCCLSGEVCSSELRGDRPTPESAFDTFRRVGTLDLGVLPEASALPFGGLGMERGLFASFLNAGL